MKNNEQRQIEETAVKPKFEVNLPIWNGPLDLLLDLIKSTEINIYDIPIKEITSQYLDAIKLMQKLDIEIASEFLVMASTLIYIKSKMLLPNEMLDNDDKELEEDPRAGLVEQLLEYQKFKELAEVLGDKDVHSNRLLERKDNQITFPLETVKEDPWKEVTLFELIKVFSGVVDVMETSEIISIKQDEFSMEEKIDMMKKLLLKEEKINFYDLFREGSSKIEIIAIFWAILEMYKYGQITIKQHAFFGDIFIFKKDAPKNLTSDEEEQFKKISSNS